MTMTNSAKSACEEKYFSPSITHASPSRAARQRNSRGLAPHELVGPVELLLELGLGREIPGHSCRSARTLSPAPPRLQGITASRGARRAARYSSSFGAGPTSIVRPLPGLQAGRTLADDA